MGLEMGEVNELLAVEVAEMGPARLSQTEDIFFLSLKGILRQSASRYAQRETGGEQFATVGCH